MKINQQNYVDEAEKVIKGMLQTNQRGEQTMPLTTSKLWNLLSMAASLKTDAQLQRENISAHLCSYDYAAALKEARLIRTLLSPYALDLLKAAKARLELNWRSISLESKKELGLLGSNQGQSNLAEYLLCLQTKQGRGDLADFLRGFVNCCG